MPKRPLLYPVRSEKQPEGSLGYGNGGFFTLCITPATPRGWGLHSYTELCQLFSYWAPRLGRGQIGSSNSLGCHPSLIHPLAHLRPRPVSLPPQNTFPLLGGEWTACWCWWLSDQHRGQVSTGIDFPTRDASVLAAATWLMACLLWPFPGQCACRWHCPGIGLGCLIVHAS